MSRHSVGLRRWPLLKNQNHKNQTKQTHTSTDFKTLVFVNLQQQKVKLVKTRCVGALVIIERDREGLKKIITNFDCCALFAKSHRLALPTCRNVAGFDGVGFNNNVIIHAGIASIFHAIVRPFEK
jgi:hypothetical protein